MHPVGASLGGERAMSRRVAVLGAGAWGTALAKLLVESGHEVVVWAHEPEVARAIEEAHENDKYLPGIALPEALHAATSGEAALQGADLAVLATPSHVTREVLTRLRPAFPPGITAVSATKGIENATLELMHEVWAAVMGVGRASSYTALSGPSFAREVAARHPTVVVVAGKDASRVEGVQAAFTSEGAFRCYGSDDLVGVEMGGALKNVIAIAAGVADGLGYGHNTRAALITRGLAEIAKVTVAKGGSALTVAGLAGMGDLVLTCTGELSRNRTVGLELGRGRTLKEAIDALGHVAEGVKTAKSAFDLGKALGIELPIIEQVYAVLYLDKPARDAVSELMGRPATREMPFVK